MKLKGYALCSKRKLKGIFFGNAIPEAAFETKEAAMDEYDRLKEDDWCKKEYRSLKEVTLIVKTIKRLK